MCLDTIRLRPWKLDARSWVFPGVLARRSRPASPFWLAARVGPRSPVSKRKRLGKSWAAAAAQLFSLTFVARARLPFRTFGLENPRLSPALLVWTQLLSLPFRTCEAGMAGDRGLFQVF